MEFRLGKNSLPLGHELEDLKARWSMLGVYEKFEQVVALALTFLISIIIVVALVDLGKEIFTLVWKDTANPLDHSIFQGVFGQIMTLLIALEFKHSILRVAARRDSIIQVKTVLLIALLAMARKFIILDAQAGDAGIVAALAFVFLVLAIGYWLIRDRDDRARPEEGRGPALGEEG